jgi:predicted patatin/cPLA2 family phospholipase
MKTTVWSVLKYFALVVGVLGTLYGAFEMWDAIRDSQSQGLENDAAILAEVSEIKQDVDSLFIREAQRDKNENELKGMILNLNAQFKFYRDHVSELEEEQMNEILQTIYDLGYTNGKKKVETVSDSQIEGTP